MKEILFSLENLAGTDVRLVEDPLHLTVHKLGRVLRHFPPLHHVASEKYFLVRVAHRHEPHRIGHPETRDHATPHGRRPLDVVARPRRHLLGTKDHLLRHPTPVEHDQLGLEPLLCIRMAILLREGGRDTKGPPPGDNADLVHRVEPGEPKPDDGMASLVVGRQPPFVLREHHAPTLGPQHDLVLGLLEIRHRDAFGSATGRQEGALIADIRQIGARQPRSSPSDDLKNHILFQGELASVDPEDLLPPLHIRSVHHHLTVKPARAEERGVQHIGAVRGSQEDDPLVGFEPVHFDEELVQSLLAFVMPSPEASTAMAPYGIDLVDEDDAGRVGLPLFKQVPHTRCTHPDEHFHEIRSGHLEEGAPRLTRHSLGQQSLSSSRRPHEEHPLRKPPAQPGKALGVLQKVDDLREFLLGFVGASHILEGDLRRVRRDELGL